MNYIHPTALIAPGVILGDNNYIGPYCVIGFPPEWKGKEGSPVQVIIGNNNRITGHVTIDSGAEGNTMIGNDCYIMKHAHIGHDAKLHNGVTISCGAKIGGHTIIGDGCNIGLNAVIHQKQKIERGCMIGMGSVVTKNLQTVTFCTYAGNPAKFIKENTQHPDYIIYMKQMV